MQSDREKISSILPYIPTSIVRRLNNLQSRFARIADLRGAILYFDLVGFSGHTALYSSRGEEGVEEFQQMLTDLYGRLLGIVNRHGGIVYQFAGDSVLIGIEKRAEETDSDTALRALSCIGEIFAGSLSNTGRVRFPFKLTASYGDYSEMVLGNRLHNYTLSVIGEPVVRAALAERHAPAEHPVIDSTLLVQLPERLRALATPFEHDLHLIEQLPQDAQFQTGSQTSVIERNSRVSLKKYAYFILPALYGKIIEGHAGFLGEFRDTVVVFVQFEDFRFSGVDRVGSARLYNRFYIDVKQRCSNFGGNLLQVDLSDKGNVFLIVFGAPVAVEHKEVTAARFALSLLEETARVNFPVTIRIGMAAGLNYCGDLGAPFRKDYTVIGKSVILASRLMTAAGANCVIVDEIIRDRIAGKFELQFIAEMEFKGMEHSAPSYQIIQEVSGKRDGIFGKDASLIGRSEEMARLRSAMAAAAKGRGEVILIEGEAGMGKSRLLGAFLEESRELDVAVCVGACFSYEQYTPYFVWKQILADFFQAGVPVPGDDSGIILQKITERLREAGDIDTRWAPALAALIGASVEEDEMTEGLDARQKRERLFEIIAELLHARSKMLPLLLCIEDAHWIDDVSLSLIDQIAKGIERAPLLIVLAARPDQQLRGTGVLPSAHTIRLHEMTEDDSREFIRQKLPLDRRDDSLEDLITGRANGNPFFIENIIQSLIEQDFVRRLDSGLWRVVKDPDLLKIPNSIQDIVHSRIDSLSEMEQVVIKTASVIGRIFLYELISRLLPVAVRENAVKHLNNLQAIDLTPIETENPLTFIFKHIVIRDVAYNSLLVSTRRELHRKIGEILEEKYSGRLSEASNILAYHYEMGGDTTRAIRFALDAADIARERYANRDAIHYYEKALSLLEQDNEHLPEMKYGVMENLAHVYRQMGDYRQALNNFRLCLVFYASKNDHMGECGIHTGMGQVYQEMGDFTKTGIELESAMKLLGKSIPSSETMTVTALANQILIRLLRRAFPKLIGRVPRKKRTVYQRQIFLLLLLSKVYFFVNVNKLAWSGFYLLNLAERMGTDRNLSLAWSNYATILQGLGFMKRSESYFIRAVEIAEKLNDPGLKALSLQRYGTRGIYLNNPEFAKSMVEKSVGLFRQVGDMWEMMMAILLDALLYYYEGNYATALEKLTELKSISNRTGSKMQYGYAVARMAFIQYLMKGVESPELSDRLSLSLEYARHCADATGEITVYGFQCRQAIYDGNPEMAARIAHQTFNAIGSFRVMIPHIQMAFVDAGEAALFAAASDLPGTNRKRLIRIAERCAKRAISLGKTFPYLLGSGWRLAGGVAAAHGDHRKSRRAFLKAIEIHESGPNLGEYAITLCAAGNRLNNTDLFKRGEEILMRIGDLRFLDYAREQKMDKLNMKNISGGENPPV
jgi:adenylate cyclase